MDHSGETAEGGPVAGDGGSAAAGGVAPRLEFTGRAGELYKIFFTNLLLTIITLGIYRFWAKTRVRKYLWSRTQFMGEPFEYTGTGRELFLGFLVVLVVVILPIALFQLLFEYLVRLGHPVAGGMIIASMYVFLLVLIGAGTYSAWRYRLSRTNWRGIHGGLDGSLLAYGVRYLGAGAATLFSLMLAMPWAQLKLASRLYNNMSFGSEKLRFAAAAKPLLKPALVVVGALLLGIAALSVLAAANGFKFQSGLQNIHGRPATILFLTYMTFLIVYSYAWVNYRARYLSHVYSNMDFGGLSFHFDISGWRLFRFELANAAIAILTLGFGMPIVHLRRSRFLAENMGFAGKLDTGGLLQSSQMSPKLGEGLAQAFDIGVGVI